MDLKQRISVFEEPTGDSVACFMISNRFLFSWLENVALLLHSGHNTLDGLFKVAQLNRLVQVTSGNQSRFVAHVGNVSTSKSLI